MITKGERIQVWRRRRGMSREVAAKVWGISVKMLRKWESNRYPETKIPITIDLGEGGLELHEELRLIRKRAGKTQEEVASELNVHRVQITQWENGEGNPGKLAVYWARLLLFPIGRS